MMDLETIDHCLALLGKVEDVLLENQRRTLAAHLSLITGQLIDERAVELQRSALV